VLLYYDEHVLHLAGHAGANKVNIDPDKDLMPVVMIAGLDNLLYVNAQNPVQDRDGRDRRREGGARQADALAQPVAIGWRQRL
jgi:hypothetical protein